MGDGVVNVARIAAELRWLWDRASDPVVVLDQEMTRAYANPAFVTEFGDGDRGQLVPRLDLNSQELLRIYASRLLANGVRVGELDLRVVSELGHGRSLTARLARLTTPEQRFVVVVITPGQDRRSSLRVRELETALARISETLEHLEQPPGSPIQHPQRDTRLDRLSTRELEIVGLARSGASAAELAAKLHVSPHTVRNHLKSIYRKLDIHSRRELIALLSAEDAASGGERR